MTVAFPEYLHLLFRSNNINSHWPYYQPIGESDTSTLVGN